MIIDLRGDITDNGNSFSNATESICTVSIGLTVPNKCINKVKKSKWAITWACYPQTNFCGVIRLSSMH